MNKVPKIIEKIEKEIGSRFHSDSSGHDIHHLKRVMNLALTIQEKEGGDREVIAVAAFLHDLHRIIEIETGKYCTPKDSLETVKAILDKFEISEEKENKILHCIEFHEEYNFTKKKNSVKDRETLIVQDADNLDAIGAIGIARGFMYAGAKNIPMWILDLPLDGDGYVEGKNDPSEIHHFHRKLLNLKDNMNTKTAKEMAQVRDKLVQEFLDQFFKEWNGEI